MYDESVKKANSIDTSGLVKKKTDYDAKINKIEGKMSSIAGLATTIALKFVI